MLKSFNKSMLLVLSILLVFSLFGCKEKPAEEPKQVEPEISIKETTPLTVVYLEKKGPYAETGKSMEELFALIEKKDVKLSGAPMGMYYDDPEKVKSEETRYEVLCPFEGEFKGDEELRVKELPAQKVACVLYTGPYDKCAPTYKKLFGWIAGQNLVPTGAPVEKYLNDPSKVKPEELKTEILVPVKSKVETEEKIED
ncbi:GyrI-like domain-containing protein [candidate division WOR-3 bacterium]|nr:GyrI-like domain-containing protein [candidate division WOR-3 bacterium]MCK4584886.1 GyrI-like domain-containing protein [candidate division WOR-3 bacterium]